MFYTAISALDLDVLQLVPDVIPSFPDKFKYKALNKNLIGTYAELESC